MHKCLVSALAAFFAYVAYAQTSQKTGVLLEAVQVPLVVNGKQVGVSTAAAGTRGQVVNESGGKVLLAVSGGQVWIDAKKMDVQNAPSAPAVAAATPKPFLTTAPAKAAATPADAPARYSVEEQRTRDRVRYDGRPLVVWTNNAEATDYPDTYCAIRDIWIAKASYNYQERNGLKSWVILANMWPSDYRPDGDTEGYIKKAAGGEALEAYHGTMGANLGNVYIEEISRDREDLVSVYVYTEPRFEDVADIERRANLGAKVFMFVKNGGLPSQVAKAFTLPLPKPGTSGPFSFDRKGNLIIVRLEEPTKKEQLAICKARNGYPLTSARLRAFIQAFAKEVDIAAKTPVYR